MPFLPVLPVTLGVTDALADPEPDELVELGGLLDVDVLLLADVLAELLTVEALVWLDVGAVLVADTDVLVTGGTTLRPALEKLDTGETAAEDCGRLVRTLVRPAWDAGFPGAAGPDGSLAWPARSR